MYVPVNDLRRQRPAGKCKRDGDARTTDSADLPGHQHTAVRLAGPDGCCAPRRSAYFTSKIFLNSAPHFWISASDSSRMAMTLALSMPAMGG